MGSGAASAPPARECARLSGNRPSKYVIIFTNMSTKGRAPRAGENSAGGVVQLTDAQGRLTMKRGIFRRGLLAVGSAALIVLAGSPSLGQVPKTGGVLSLRLREDLPQGFAINGELA